MKTIAFVFFCLVLCILPGCGSEPVEHVTHSGGVTAVATGQVHSFPPYNVVEPDSLKVPVVWNSTSQLLVRAVYSENFVDAGDTILSGTDPFFSVEVQRLEMALGMAEATGDSSAVDSLTALLADSSMVAFVVSPVSGVIENTVFAGSTLEPGDTVAVVNSGTPDSVYILVPSYSHIRWPEGLEGCTVTEAGLQCTGARPGDTAFLQGTWSLQQRYIYEDDLDSFVITTAGDTIPVSVIGSTDTSKIIYSVFPLDSVALTPW